LGYQLGGGKESKKELLPITPSTESSLGLFSEFSVLSDLAFICNKMESPIRLSDISEEMSICIEELDILKRLFDGETVKDYDVGDLEIPLTSEISKNLGFLDCESFWIGFNMRVDPFNEFSLGEIKAYLNVAHAKYSVFDSDEKIVIHEADFSVSLVAPALPSVQTGVSISSLQKSV
jgi:hypothetical protein